MQKKKINNKAGRGADAQAPFCSIAHSLSCTAQPGAVLAHPLLGVLHKRLKSSRYRQDTPNPHFFFFFSPRQTSCFVARQQVSSPLRQAARGVSASWQRWGTGLRAPLCNARCERSLGHIMPLELVSSINSCFTGSSPHLHHNNKAQIGDVPLEMLIFTADCCIFHSC